MSTPTPKKKAVAPPAKWEYLVRQIDRRSLEADMNLLGAEGWELVAVVKIVTQGGSEPKSWAECVLKCPAG